MSETSKPTISPLYDRVLQRLAFWLMGWPDRYRPWPVAWCGNRIQDVRYHIWRVRGGL